MSDEGKPAPTGRAKGGAVTAAKMTPAELRARAQKGADARWGPKPLLVTHKGNFKDEFGMDVECYVLNDEHKTAVISQTGFAKAIGLSSRGNALPRFLGSQAMAGALGAELEGKLQNPLKFQWTGTGAGGQQLHGYDATLLVDLCRAILTANADGRLKPQQQNVVAQAAIIMGASAKAGIKGLVYALAGYRPEIEEVIQAFKVYVQEEARKYEQEFPNELYMQWHRLYDIPVLERGRSWHMKNLTVNHIYIPLANSNGRLLGLLRDLKATDGERKKKLFQFLNEIGARALRMHLGRVLEMCESSKDRHEYENKIVGRFGGQQALDLLPPSAEPAD